MKEKFLVRENIAKFIRKKRIFIFKILGYDLQWSTIIERNVLLDKLYPKKIHIGANTLVGSGTVILSHDHCKRVGNNLPFSVDTFVGCNCFIGVKSIILPGIRIGDEVIVGAGSVVTKDVPSNSVVVGNPAKIIRTGIKMNNFAALENWNEDLGWI
jgi:acetyltransferase-like isoleucine patch superfamily enzyme